MYLKMMFLDKVRLVCSNGTSATIPLLVLLSVLFPGLILLDIACCSGLFGCFLLEAAIFVCFASLCASSNSTVLAIDGWTTTLIVFGTDTVVFFLYTAGLIRDWITADFG